MSKPSFRRLVIFDAVTRLGSAGAAANEVGLSQPAVTHALHKLEGEVGSRLFERGAGGSSPTKAGRVLHRRIERMLKQVETGFDEAATGSSIRRGGTAFRNLTSVQVRTHLAIAQEGSFRTAAQALDLAEPTLQRAARDLERVVGARLYRRTPQGMAASPAGLALAGRFRLAFYELDQALDELAAEHDASGGRVSAGCLPLMPKPVVARTVALLLQAYPGVHVELQEASHEDLSKALRHGELDMFVGALRYPRLVGDLTERVLFRDPHVVVVRADHPLALKDEVMEADLARYSWVAPTRNTPRRAFVDDLFARLPERPRIVAETSSLTLMTALLMESDCLTLVSRAQAMREFSAIGLTALPIRLPAAERTVGVTMRRDWLPTIVQRRFLTLLRQECRNVGLVERRAA